MSDQPKLGPVLNEAIREVRGSFPGEAALQEAMKRLESAGFDRAQINLPVPDAARPTPAAGAETPLSDTDAQQMRTLGSSTAAAAGAMLAAGATVLTGGAAAVAVIAAAAAGAAAGGGVLAATSAGDTARQDAHEARAQSGELLLSVTLQGDEDPARAESIMRDCGAIHVACSRREGA